MRLHLEDLIRLFLTERDSLSTSELAGICGVSDRHVRREIQKMPDVQPERSGRTVRYSLLITEVSFPPRPSSPAATTAAPSGSQEGSGTESHQNAGKEGLAPPVGGSKHRTSDPVLTPYSAAEYASIDDSLPISTGRSALSGPLCGASDKPAAHVAPIVHGSCPLSGVTMEHDTIRYLVRDPKFRRALFAMAEQCDWKIRTSRNGIYVYAHHITFFTGRTTTAVYSDEPTLLRPYADRLTEAFGPDSDAGLIAAYLREEEPSHVIYDEWTTVVDDPAMLQSILKAIAPLVRADGTYRRAGPDLQTPGLKIYARDGMMRIETIATNQLQREAAYRFHDELHRVLRQVPTDSPALLRLITRWYNGGNICAGMDCLLESLKKLDGLHSEEIMILMQKHLALSAEASAVFLAAYGLWASKNFRAAVRPDQITQVLSAEGITLTGRDLDEAVKQLCTAGLCRSDERYAICFSRAGTRFGRELLNLMPGVMA